MSLVERLRGRVANKIAAGCASNFVRRRNPREKTSLNEKIKPSTSAAAYLWVAERESKGCYQPTVGHKVQDNGEKGSQ